MSTADNARQVHVDDTHAETHPAANDTAANDGVAANDETIRARSQHVDVLTPEQRERSKPAKAKVIRPPFSREYADSALIVPRADRGSLLTQFLVKQGGGYDPHYYRADEARSSSILAPAKFVSVSLATFSFMKAIWPAFETKAMNQLPQVANVDLKYAFAAAAGGALWWGISKLDTAVLHGMRATKAARHANEEWEIGKKNALKTHWSGIAFRIGISVASLGITMPALLVTASETTVNEYIKRNTNDANAPILNEQKARLAEVDAYIAKLRAQLSTLQATLAGLQNPGSVVNDTQHARLDTLTAQLQDLARQKQDNDRRMLELETKRDAAKARMDQEEKGARGSVVGRGSLFRNAEADFNDANREIATLKETVTRTAQSVTDTNTEINTINTDVTQATKDRDGNLAERKATTTTQIANIQDELQKQQGVHDSLSDIDGLASRDPRYTKLNPQLAQQVGAYVQYMTTEANGLEWSRALFMTLMISCMELGVFALAAARPLNAGEIKGFLANAIKSQEAADMYKSVIATLKEQSEDPLSDAAISRNKRRKLVVQDAELFAEALAAARHDPKLREEMVGDLVEASQAMRMRMAQAASTVTVAPAPKPGI